MSLVSLNDVSVIRGNVDFHIQGRWQARLVLSGDEPSKVLGPVTLSLGSLVLQGTAIIAAADSGNLVSVQVVGGMAGLEKPCPPKDYGTPTTLGTVLRDALAEGGESLSTSSDQAILDRVIHRWTRVLDNVGNAFKQVLKAQGDLTFRVLPDGTYWVGQDSWPQATGDFKVLSESPAEQRIVLGLEDALVMPGQVLQGQKLTSVSYCVDDTSLRAVASYAEGRSVEALALATFVRAETAHLDLTKTLTAEVVGQNGDQSLELKMGDPSMPHLSRVPMRLGIPGVVTARVTPGTLVLVAHENADNQRPVVVGFAEGQVLSLAIGSPDITLGFPIESAGPAGRGDYIAQELAKIALTLASLTSAAGPVTSPNPYVPGNVLSASVKIV